MCRVHRRYPHAHAVFHSFSGLGRAYDPVGERLLARTATFRGLDGVVTTNHDYYREFDLGDEAVAVLPGIEVTTTKGYALVVGPNPPKRTPEDELTPEEVVELAHDGDCAAIIAHPFRNSTLREADADFDAIEVNGKGTDPAEWVKQLARNRGLPMVGGSDAHYPFEVGRAATEIEAEDLTAESVATAIRDGRVTPRVDRSPFQQLLRRAYKAIHGQKGRLEHPAPEPPGLGTPPGETENPPPPRESETRDSRR